MSELLPCPFCGGEAETLTAESMYGGYLFGIMCNDCRSRGDVYDTEAEAIAAWNSRAERTCRIVERQEEPQDDVLVRDYTFSCGHCICWAHTYEPRYCPNCGCKVVSE